MLNFEDLPDELVLKVLSYSETKDLLSFGQLSKRFRRISHDGKLWVIVNLEKKFVKTEFLEMIIGKGCRILNLSYSTIIGSLSSNIKSQLRVLNLSHTLSFFRSKMILDSPHCFGQVQNVLIWSKSIWLGSNRIFLDYNFIIFTNLTRPKQLLPVQNYMDGPKS